MEESAETPEKKEYVKPVNIESLLFVLGKRQFEGSPIRSWTREGFGLDWYLEFECEDDKPNHYAVVIKCNEDTFSNVWEFSCSMELELVKPGNQKVGKAEKKFDSDNNSVIFPDFLEYDPTNPDSPCFRICLRLIMKELVGLSKNLEFDFENKHEITSDATLVAFDEEEKKEKVLHVSKSYLSLYSPVFRKMFIKLEQKQKPAEIKLRYDYKAVVILLNLVYPSHCLPEDWYNTDTSDSEDFDTVLRMADRFKFDFALRRLEKFIIRSIDISPNCKLHYAETHKLHRLMNHCLNGIESVSDAENAVRDETYEDSVLSSKTRAAIFARVISLPPTRKAESDSENSYYY